DPLETDTVTPSPNPTHLSPVGLIVIKSLAHVLILKLGQLGRAKSRDANQGQAHQSQEDQTRHRGRDEIETPSPLEEPKHPRAAQCNADVRQELNRQSRLHARFLMHEYQRIVQMVKQQVDKRPD